jgi:UrcA family protein
MTAFKIALTSFVITAGLIKGAPALAQPVATPSVNVSVVHTADLDLTSDAGKRQLDRRLSQAARDVCGTASDFDLEGKNDVRACRDQVLARAHSDRDQLLASAVRTGSITVAAGR